MLVIEIDSGKDYTIGAITIPILTFTYEFSLAHGNTRRDFYFDLANLSIMNKLNFIIDNTVCSEDEEIVLIERTSPILAGYIGTKGSFTDYKVRARYGVGVVPKKYLVELGRK